MTLRLSTVTSIIREDARLAASDLDPELRALAGTSLLVTGAGGFLLSYLLDVVAAWNQLGSAAPCHVIAVDNFQTGLPDRVQHLVGDPHVEFRTHDVTKPLAPKRPVEWVVHGASIASPTLYRRFPLETIDVNVNGTWRMLDLARAGARSMLYLSTSEIYGDPDPAAVPTTEDYRGNVSCTGPRACYDESKRLGETLCMTYFRAHGTPVKIIRPFNIYGPGQRLDDQRILPDLMSAALEHRPIVLLSDGRATRSFCYVRDAIRAILLVMVSNENGCAFNVGNDREISISTLAETMAAVAAPPRIPVEYRVSDDKDYLSDNPQRRCPDLTKLRVRTRWTPEVDLEEGLRRTLDSYREAAERGR